MFQDVGRSYDLRADYAIFPDRREAKFSQLRLRFDSTLWAATRPGAVRWGQPGIEVETIELTNGATAGWMYLNLDNATNDTPLASQNWVVVSMRAEGRYSVDFDAAWLANGCTPEEPISEVTTGSEVIGPGVAETPGDQSPNFNPDDPLLP